MGMIIAIDGPAGSGKGTIASLLAKKYNLLNVDTGAFYRALTVACINNNISVDEKDKIIELAKKVKLSQDKDGRTYLDGVDVSKEIRSEKVTNLVSYVSSIPEVRYVMVDIQRGMAEHNDLVMEGRDITTVVFPNATYKFYLDASIDERAKRRFKQNNENNINIPLEQTKLEMEERDYNDSHKEVGSLRIADDAIYIDSTNLSIDEVLKKITDVIEV